MRFIKDFLTIAGHIATGWWVALWANDVPYTTEAWVAVGIIILSWIASAIYYRTSDK